MASVIISQHTVNMQKGPNGQLQVTLSKGGKILGSKSVSLRTTLGEQDGRQRQLKEVVDWLRQTHDITTCESMIHSAAFGQTLEAIS